MKPYFFLDTFHNLIILSSEAETRHWPSGENWTERIVDVWALKLVEALLTLGIHSRIVLSLEHEAISLLLGENDASFTQFLWPKNLLKKNTNNKKLCNSITKKKHTLFSMTYVLVLLWLYCMLIFVNLLRFQTKNLHLGYLYTCYLFLYEYCI